MKLIKSVAKPLNSSAGAPTPKEPNVTLVRTRDILAWPTPDAGGVNLLGNYVLKAGAKMLQLYLTPSKTSSGFESEGDEDAVGVSQKYEGSHPGNSIEIREFILAALGEDFIIISGTCRDTNKTSYGTKCSPMKLKPTFSENGDGTMHAMVFEQYMRTDQVPYNYTGTIEFAVAYPVVGDAISLLVANGTSYQLAANAVTAALDVDAFDLVHGTVVSLIGGGGADPATLASGVTVGTPSVEVVLKDDTSWIALQNATISLEVFEAGATTYLIERARS
jgi:hypothetical protein